MSDNDTLFWRMLALFQSLPDLQPAQIVDWLAQESGETLTPERLATLTQPQLAALFIERVDKKQSSLAEMAVNHQPILGAKCRQQLRRALGRANDA